jgi:hypothetical protein
VLLRVINGRKLAKSQSTCKVHVRCVYPADHTQRPAKEFWHDHDFLRAPCDFRFAVSPQGTCTKKERCPCDLLAHVASLKWGVRGKKWHPNNYATRTCLSLSTCLPRVKYVSSDYNLRDSCLASACAAWVARGIHGARTRSTPHGTSTSLLKDSCNYFGCSMKVQLWKLINVSNEFQNTDQTSRKKIDNNLNKNLKLPVLL